MIVIKAKSIELLKNLTKQQLKKSSLLLIVINKIYRRSLINIK